jgi:hypothetical protein
MDEKSDMTINEIHEILSDTGVTLSGMFWELTKAEQTDKHEGDKWCPLEVLINMRQVAEVYCERVKRVLKSEDKPPFLYDFDEEKQMLKVRLEDESVRANLQAFLRARSELLNSVSLIDKDLWETKKANHEISGIVSLRQLLIPLAVREKNNLEYLLKYLIP